MQYIKLKTGDRIMSGDQFYNPNNDTWNRCHLSVGEPVGDDTWVRRPKVTKHVLDDHTFDAVIEWNESPMILYPHQVTITGRKFNVDNEWCRMNDIPIPAWVEDEE